MTLANISAREIATIAVVAIVICGWLVLMLSRLFRKKAVTVEEEETPPVAEVEVGQATIKINLRDGQSKTLVLKGTACYTWLPNHKYGVYTSTARSGFYSWLKAGAKFQMLEVEPGLYIPVADIANFQVEHTPYSVTPEKG